MQQEKKINESSKEDKSQIYEIGYLLVSSVPEDKVASEVQTLKDYLVKKGADFIGEENPELRALAYTMVKKIGSSNHRFEQGYFGWFKFEIAKKEIEEIKKTFESNPNMLRLLIISTIRENTYLGKKSPIATLIKPEELPVAEVSTEALEIGTVPLIVDEMDKSIDAMVKEA